MRFPDGTPQAPTSAKSHGRAPHESGKASRRRARRLESVRGPFEFRRPDKNRTGDLDNGIKPLMDWMQRVELIEDDRTYPGRHSST